MGHSILVSNEIPVFLPALGRAKAATGRTHAKNIQTASQWTLQPNGGRQAT